MGDDCCGMSHTRSGALADSIFAPFSGAEDPLHRRVVRWRRDAGSDGHRVECRAARSERDRRRAMAGGAGSGSAGAERAGGPEPWRGAPRCRRPAAPAPIGERRPGRHPTAGGRRSATRGGAARGGRGTVPHRGLARPTHGAPPARSPAPPRARAIGGISGCRRGGGHAKWRPPPARRRCRAGAADVPPRASTPSGRPGGRRFHRLEVRPGETGSG